MDTAFGSGEIVRSVGVRTILVEQAGQGDRAQATGHLIAEVASSGSHVCGGGGGGGSGEIEKFAAVE
jgi:hypothetical protein